MCRETNQPASFSSTSLTRRFFDQRIKELSKFLGNVDSNVLDSLRIQWKESKLEPKEYQSLFLIAKACSEGKGKDGSYDMSKIAEILFGEIRSFTVTGKEEDILWKSAINAIDMMPDDILRMHSVSENMPIEVDSKYSLMESLFRTLLRHEHYQKGGEYFFSRINPYVCKNRTNPVDELRDKAKMGYFFLKSHTAREDNEVRTFERYSLWLADNELTNQAVSLAGKIGIAANRIKVLTTICQSLIQKSKLQLSMK